MLLLRALQELSSVGEMGDRLATIVMVRKVCACGGAVPLLWGGELGLPSNTMWPGPRPIPSYQVAS